MNDNKSLDIHKKVCLDCGFLNEDDSMFCIECGAKLGEDTNKKDEVISKSIDTVEENSKNDVEQEKEEVILNLEENIKKNTDCKDEKKSLNVEDSVEKDVTSNKESQKNKAAFFSLKINENISYKEENNIQYQKEENDFEKELPKWSIEPPKIVVSRK